MENLNYIFFEDYKRLDRLCGELYNDSYGITHYIDDMKTKADMGYQYVPNWKYDLNTLVRLRHIRNHLAHSEGSFYENVCTKEDIDWVQSFYDRIMTRSDPLAILYQKLRMKNQKPKPAVNTGQTGRKKNIQKEKELSWMEIVLSVTVILAIVMILLFSAFMLYSYI